ncbi:MAG: cytochrome-c oxidase, cbb3-type subunit III [Pseudomonadota bacterium]|jgi:cytochrome c oxidase cbb3-type subunit 3|nr:MAG: cytochrome-c oxidase, cbb3-type subunit III [Pseudomonadota bacterium]HEX5600587.1 cytochrome-c oxidase, cbb3-type subunit III [Hyphomicrobiaceae bacterium]
MSTKEIDEVTGVETTGHEWDGIKELNKPLPKWWVWTFWATIIWSIGYWVLYPAFPTLTGYTKGVLGYSQRAVVAEQIEAARAEQAKFRDALAATPLEQVKDDPELLRFAMAGGAAVFADNCAPCHGRGAQGFPGYPNLNDDEWLWGGSIEDIHNTIRFGIRSGHPEGRDSQMPRFGIDQLLDRNQISDTAEYVLSLSGRATDEAAVARGREIFAEQCVACHGEDGKGNVELGAPNLADAIWLYGGSKEDIMESIRTGRGGQMPSWEGRLDPVTIKSLAVYVHSLGGGQ